MSSFTARPPDLRRLSFDHRGLSVISPLATLGVASDPVLVNRPAVSLPASFPRSVTLPQLRLASFGMVSFREDFHLQDDVHARRTKEKAGRGCLPAIVAWGAGRLCRPRTVAGGYGNPLRVPISEK